MNIGSYTYDFARPAMTADCVVLCHGTESLEVLLIDRRFGPFKGCWALPGGFMMMDEDAETAARRELYEETGVRVDKVEQCGAFTDVDRDPRERVVTIAYYALIDKTEAVAADDAQKAEWFPVDALPPLAFDHDRIIQSAMNDLWNKRNMLNDDRKEI